MEPPSYPIDASPATEKRQAVADASAESPPPKVAPQLNHTRRLSVRKGSSQARRSTTNIAAKTRIIVTREFEGRVIWENPYAKKPSGGEGSVDEDEEEKDNDETAEKLEGADLKNGPPIHITLGW
ncbi:hypothetical protein BJ742DRAFT_769664 [Cladochytrium replicatum]|nr:hypothetical protein BJ742DRAFT_769664 [Cladochytrium replicatum]